MEFDPPGSWIAVFGLMSTGMVAFLAVSLWNAGVVSLDSYYDFADQRILMGIPNFWNVISNLPFAVVGWLGLRAASDWAWRVLFGGVFLTAFGSAYFHLAPGDATLVWDRIPMTLVFMSLLAIVMGEVRGKGWRERLLWPLVLIGMASVAWWYWTGNVLPYGVVQFGPMVALLPLMYWNVRVRKLKPVLTLYVLAKIAELLDRPLYAATPLSGHSWKHLLAAAATYSIYRWFRYLSDQTASSLPLGSVK